MKGERKMSVEGIVNGALDKWDGIEVPDVVEGIDPCGDDPNALSNLQAAIANRKSRDGKSEDAPKAIAINDKLKFLRQFISWAFWNRVLSEMPRNLREVTKRVPVKKSGEPLLLKDVRKIWRNADPKMRCWIALGLNCAFMNSDIAGLKADDISDGRLISRRRKTGVPMNYKLWAVTLDLIEQTRMDRDEDTGGLLYVNAEGNPVVTETGSDRVGHAFKKLANKAAVACTFQQSRHRCPGSERPDDESWRVQPRVGPIVSRIQGQQHRRALRQQ